MATLEEAINTFLLTQSSITAYVGTDIFFPSLPVGMDTIQTDFIIYFMVSASNDPVSFGDKTTAQPIFQFSIFSKDASRALAIGNLLFTALHGFSGTLATGISVTLSSAQGPDISRDASDEQWYHGIVEWQVEYTRS